MEWAHQNELTGAPLNGSLSLKTPLVWSAVLHAGLVSIIVASAFIDLRGDSWGGTGSGSMSVGLVRSLPGVPLPRPESVTTSRVVEETKGLHREEPAKVTPPPQKATPIQEFAKNQPQKYITGKSKVLEDPNPPPEGAIPHGQGGQPALPYSQFNMAGQTQGGLAFEGSGGGFGSRFPWYVEAVQRRVSRNWLQSTVDPSVRWAPRMVVTFTVLRNGTITNVQILRSSGNASVDNSAVRAILSSSPAERLPSEYSGNSVNVEFWFEFRR
jgi:protein TonB